MPGKTVTNQECNSFLMYQQTDYICKKYFTQRDFLSFEAIIALYLQLISIQEYEEILKPY